MESYSSNPNPIENRDHDYLEVAISKATGYVKVHGRGSFKISSSLKDFVNHLLDNNGKDLVVDVCDCLGMDSTFMGVMAGISQRLKREAHGTVTLLGASPKIVKLLSTLGLSRLVTFQDAHTDAGRADAKPDLAPLEKKNETPLESAETMLEAHEKLVEIEEDNTLRFQDVLEYLKEDIRRQGG